MHTSPTVIASRYRVIKEIGRGGFGVVYLVKHENTGEYHAVKVLHESELGSGETLERFKREMRLPAKIRSEHVARITDADIAPELGGAPFLVMDLLNGCDLGKILTKSGARPAGEVAWILGQAARALDKAHVLDIVHRDLKPENLFIHIREDGSYITKVLDFGIAKVKDDMRRTPSGSDKRHVNTQSTIGTPLYMSPEQARGPSPGDPPIGLASDIWSMGMVTFELLTGEPYWQADNPMVLLSQIFFAHMKPPSARFPPLTQKFDHWFARSCDRNPANRWVSASKQLDALLDALNIREMPSEIPEALAQQVISLTPLHLEDLALKEPSLYRIVSPKREDSPETLVGVNRPSSLRARDADSVPSAIAEMPTEKFDSKRHPQPLRDTVPGAPSEDLLAKARDSAPVPIFDLPTEPFDPKKHRKPPGAVGSSAAEPKTLPGRRDDNSPAPATDAPTSALRPQDREPATLPLAVLHQSLTAGPREVASQPTKDMPAKTASRNPLWLPVAFVLVFMAGLAIGGMLFAAH